MSAAQEYVGYTSTAIAAFQQSGGINTVTVSRSAAAASTCSPAARSRSAADWSTRASSAAAAAPPFATLDAGGVLDLTAGLWQNLGDISLNMAANSLLVTPAGFNPATAFGSYSSQGLVYTPGTTLTVPAGKGFAGTYSFNDPVVCQGTITAANGLINLNNGLTASGNAVVSLGGGNLKSSVTVSGNASVTLGSGSVASGNLTVNGSTSSISGGLLSSYNTYLGYNGTGAFAQTGGTNTASNNFYFGLQHRATSALTTLSGGLLSAPTGYYSNATGSEYVGYLRHGDHHPIRRHQRRDQLSRPGLQLRRQGNLQHARWHGRSLSDRAGFYGTGAFNQSGGTVGAGFVEVAYAAPPPAAPTPSAPAACKRARSDVGDTGTGTFTQLGGTNSVNGNVPSPTIT